MVADSERAVSQTEIRTGCSPKSVAIVVVGATVILGFVINKPRRQRPRKIGMLINALDESTLSFGVKGP